MSSQRVRGRFAPSPTGAIHLGNLWTALLAWLDVRQRGGACILRIEDLDPDRSRSAWTAQLLADLRWCGLDWDEGPDHGGPHTPYAQDKRRTLYANALAQLQARNLVYRCFCTRAEVRAAASAPHGQQPREQCPNHCYALSPVAVAARLQKRKPCWRVRVPATTEPLSFVDRCMGAQHENLEATAGDFVVCRADGVHAYQLAVVVDDGLMGITDVVRGADLLDSTARQIWLHQQLGFAPPQFAHVPLLIDHNGHRLSKRQASLAIAELRASGYRATTIIGWLAHWAGLRPTFTDVTPHDLIGQLDLARLPHDPIVVEVDEHSR